MAVLGVIRDFAKAHGLRIRPGLDEKQLQKTLRANFQYFVAGNRQEQWLSFIERQRLPALRYDDDRGAELLGPDFSARFSLATNLQRTWMHQRIRRNLGHAVTYWPSAVLRSLQ